jgi:hypothetical protein
MPQVNFNILGGPFNGYSPQQTITNYKDSDVINMRRVLIRSRSALNVKDTINNKGRVLTPFRAANNLGDFLGRQYYVDGSEPNPQSASRPGYARLIGSAISNRDGTGVTGASCNPKFVSDSSDYIKFKRQSATNRNFNDLAFGGYNNAAYSRIKMNF